MADVQEGASETEKARNLEKLLSPTYQLMAVTFSASYQLPRRIGIRISIPIEDKNLGEPNNVRVTSVGDLRLEGTYDLLAGRTGAVPRLAISAGLTIPTGKTRPDPIEGQFGTSLQGGSGTVDPLLGIETVHRFTASLFAYAALSARISVYANSHGYQTGPSLLYGAGVGYRLWRGRLVALLGVESSHRFRDRRDGAEILNTGGLTIYLAPGLRWRVFGGLSLTTRVGVPVYRFVNRVQLVEAFNLQIGISCILPPFVSTPASRKARPASTRGAVR